MFCFSFLINQKNSPKQIMTDTPDPAAVARPMGNSVSVKYFDARYASGILAHTMEMELCMKENPDNPQAQK